MSGGAGPPCATPEGPRMPCGGGGACAIGGCAVPRAGGGGGTKFCGC